MGGLVQQRPLRAHTGAATKAGLVPSVRRLQGGEWIDTYLPEDVDEFAARHFDRLALDAAAADFGVTAATFVQLVAGGVVTANGPRLPGDAPMVTRGDLGAFTSGLLSLAIGEVDDPVSIHRAMIVVAQRPKPWGRVIRMLLDRAIPFTTIETRGRIGETRSRGVGTPAWSIRIPKASLGLVAAAVPTAEEERAAADLDLTPLETAELLNLPPKTVPTAMITPNTARARGRARYGTADVVEMSRKLVSADEIALRRAWSPAAAPKRLRDAGVPSVGRHLRCRQTVERMLLDGTL